MRFVVMVISIIIGTIMIPIPLVGSFLGLIVGAIIAPIFFRKDE